MRLHRTLPQGQLESFVPPGTADSAIAATMTRMKVWSAEGRDTKALLLAPWPGVWTSLIRATDIVEGARIMNRRSQAKYH